MAENQMDIMFGFFEKQSRYSAAFPIALPQRYGSFNLYVGGLKQQLADCDPGKHFLGVSELEGTENFFPDTRLLCLNTEEIDVGGSGFIED